MVELVEHKVGHALRRQPSVVLPSRGVGVAHIDHGSPPAIAGDGLGEDARGLAPTDVEGVEDALQVALDLDGPTVVAHLLHLHLLILLAATTGSVEAERGTGRGIEGEHRTLGRILHLAKRLLRLQGLRGEQQGHTTGHHQLSHHTLAGNFVRMDSCLAETRGILWRVPRDGQARPIITIYNVAKSKILC